ncbi:MAG: hypothetical protein KatS3mg115_0044 [Candidatus Poribacteria bacterium]|nr:MAG: hypothetical protein KatS3mg115_0044 [Candidatus Poribacteria bacterium]
MARRRTSRADRAIGSPPPRARVETSSRRIRWQAGRPGRVSWRSRAGACAPWIAVILLLVAVAYREVLGTESRRWEECQQIYAAGEVARLDVLEEYLQRYPEGEHAETVRYYYARLAAERKDCSTLRPWWETLLDAQNRQYRTEAMLALADCAFQEERLEEAASYYRRIAEEDPNAPAAVLATLRLGTIAEREGDLIRAAAAYRRVWEHPAATPEQFTSAARRWGALYLSQLRPEGERYIVRRGDNLTRIAQRYGLQLREVLAANPQLQDPSRLEVGQVLRIPLSLFSVLVSLEDGALYLLHRGEAVRVYPVSVGELDRPTPTGVYRSAAPLTDPNALEELLLRRPELHSIGVGRGWVALIPSDSALHGGGSLDRLRKPKTPGTVQLLDEDLLELVRWLPANSEVRIVPRASEVRWAVIPSGAP